MYSQYKKELHMTQQERLRYLVEGLVAEYNERHNEHIEIPMNEEEQFTLF